MTPLSGLITSQTAEHPLRRSAAGRGASAPAGQNTFEVGRCAATGYLRGLGVGAELLGDVEGAGAPVLV